MNMLINGEFVPSSDHSAIDVINPYDGTLVDQVPAATAFDVNRAVLAAKEAQKSWKKVPVHERAAIVYRFLPAKISTRPPWKSEISSPPGEPSRKRQNISTAPSFLPVRSLDMNGTSF